VVILFFYQLVPIGKQETATIDEYLFSDSENSTITKIMDSEEKYKQNAESIYLKLIRKHKKQYEWIRSIFFTNTLKEDLLNDNKFLFEIININQKWEPENDRKLSALINLCNYSHPNEKILIFTQYSDTAEYIYRNLKDKIDGLEGLVRKAMIKEK